jgi:hypothetical protein
MEEQRLSAFGFWLAPGLALVLDPPPLCASNAPRIGAFAIMLGLGFS